MDRSIQAGFSGALIAITVNLFSPMYFYFIPSFFAALFVIYLFRLGTLKDCLIASFMTYIFNEGILSSLASAILYVADEPYMLTLDIWMVFSPVVTSISALIAGYIGVRLVQRMKPTPSLPPPLPPV